MPNIRCLFGRHDWRFSYNHGMPRGLSLDDALELYEDGKTYAVYQCTRCPKQSREDGTILEKKDMEVA